MIIVLIAGSTSVDAQRKQKTASTSQSDAVTTEELADGLNHPWGMVFLPDGRLLLTERAGALRILDRNNKLSDPLEGVPEVFTSKQGGMLDVALDPDFERNGHIYLSFSEPEENGNASTALGRGKLEDNRLADFQVIFRQEPKVDGPNHFGGRIVFSPEGNIFLTTGERFKFQPAQEKDNHLGKIIHVKTDGSPVEGNPFASESNARPEIWSYGHRNIEAAAFDPATGRFWIAEMGPEGGDELNIIRKGKNYGWPVVSWGKHYNGKSIPDPTTRPEFEDAVLYWTPVISPSGMLFYDGELFPEFKGNMLIGGLTAKGLVRVEVNGEKAKEVGRIDLGERIRDVEQAPDGSIYVLTDKRNGSVLKLTPKAVDTASK